MTGADFNHRLIMFTGPSGAGKSTLSRRLHEQLGHHGIPSTLLTEDEVYRLEALQAFTAEWSRSEPGALSTLLDAVRSLCAGWLDSGTVWITDQFLPAVHWLQSKYPPEQVQAYLAALAPILAPLHPLLISLEADVHVAWQRQVAERGEGWSDWMVELFNRRDYPQDLDAPLRGPGDLLRRFAAEQTESRALLARWPVETLVLDTTATPLDRLEAALLQRVGLSDALHSTGESQRPSNPS